VDGIRERCGWIAPVAVYLGELEQEALAHSVLRALRGEEPILQYAGKPVWEGFGGIGL
jgi:butyrate kinase